MLLAMSRRLRRTQASLAIAFALALAIGPELAEAQDAQGTPSAAPAAPPAPAQPAAPEPAPAAQAPTPAAPAGQAEPSAPAADRFSPEELRNLLKPIALYPDPLLAKILMAATYPLDVVEAARWVQDPRNAKLKGDQLFAGVQQQDWDASVKSLAPFPSILDMMDVNLEWTERLGEAFLADPKAVMEAIQRLRRRAAARVSRRATEVDSTGRAAWLATAQ